MLRINHLRPASVTLVACGAVVALVAASGVGTARAADAPPTPPTITATIPSSLVIGEDGVNSATFTARLQNPGAALPSNQRADFTITPKAGVTVAASDITLQYNEGTSDAPNWQDVPLTKQSDGTFTGYFGPNTGFPVGAAYDKTSTYRVGVDDAFPVSTLSTVVTLDSVDSESGAVTGNTVTNSPAVTSLTSAASLVSAIPTNLTGGTATTFTGEVKNASGTADYHAVIDFTIVPTSTKFTASDLTLEYDNGDGYTAIPLTQDGGSITGTFGPTDGFEVDGDYDTTTTFQVTSSSAAPSTYITSSVVLEDVNSSSPLSAIGPATTLSCSLNDGTEYAGAVTEFLADVEPTLNEACLEGIALDAGTLSRLTLTTSLTHSAAGNKAWAEFIYETVLQREADPGGLANLEGQLARGRTVQSLMEAVSGGAEFAKDAGGTRAGIVELLYETFLGRDVDPSGAGAYGRYLATHSVSAAATALVNSREGLAYFVDNAYEDTLNRDADPSGLAAYSSFLAHGGNYSDMYARLAAGSEAYGDLLNPPTNEAARHVGAHAEKH